MLHTPDGPCRRIESGDPLRPVSIAPLIIQGEMDELRRRVRQLEAENAELRGHMRRYDPEYIARMEAQR